MGASNAVQVIYCTASRLGIFLTSHVNLLAVARASLRRFPSILLMKSHLYVEMKEKLPLLCLLTTAVLRFCLVAVEFNQFD